MGIFRGVAYADGVASGCSGSGNALSHGNSQILRKFPGIADGEAMPKIASVALNHQHAEDFVINMPLDERRRASQYFIQLQRSVHFLADFSERGQHFGGDFRAAV